MTATRKPHLLIRLPHSHIPVKAPAYNHLTITRPHYARNKVWAALQHLELLPWGDIPYTYSLVIASTDDESIIRRQRNAPHSLRMPSQSVFHCGLLALIEFPNKHCLVIAGTCKEGCFGIDNNTRDRCVMAAQRLHGLLPSKCIPHTHNCVTSPTCNKFAVWRPCCTHQPTGQTLAVPPECEQ